MIPAASEVGDKDSDNKEEDKPTANESEPGSLNSSTQSLVGTQQSAYNLQARSQDFVIDYIAPSPGLETCHVTP